MAERGDSNQSQFTARADNAALKLRQSLQQQGRQVTESSPVAVGPDGKPPAPPPPEGSYMRRMVEQQQQLGDQPPAGTTEQMIDGSQAPPLARAEDHPTQEPEREQVSDNAARRIRELLAEIKAKEAENQQLLELGRQQGSTLGQLQQKFEMLQRQHEQLIESNLDSLDPETRIQVMQDARIREALDGVEKRILSQLMPHIQSIESKSKQSEMMALSDTYPSFDLQIHGPLIDMFRGKNPHCSIEQAFRAIAEPHELVTRAAASAAAVPPVVPPGNGGARPRYQPEPQSQTDPEQELIEEAQRLKALRSSTDPAEQKAGMSLAHEHLKRRLFGP